MKKKLIIYLLKKLGYIVPDIKQQQDWKPGYVRYFNVLWYPKEGWINIFHNYESDEELNRTLQYINMGRPYGPPIPKDSIQPVVIGEKRAD